MQRAADEIVAAKTRHERGEYVGLVGSTRVVWNCLNRYVRMDLGPHGITLLFVHSNGSHKEVRRMRCCVCWWPCAD